jgi:hypothetical protein
MSAYTYTPYDVEPLGYDPTVYVRVERGANETVEQATARLMRSVETINRWRMIEMKSNNQSNSNEQGRG